MPSPDHDRLVAATCEHEHERLLLGLDDDVAQLIQAVVRQHLLPHHRLRIAEDGPKPQWLCATELRKQFPGLDFVIYNEHFDFGRVQWWHLSCSTVEPETRPAGRGIGTAD
jgi:hypothetical protein